MGGHDCKVDLKNGELLGLRIVSRFSGQHFAASRLTDVDKR